MNIRAKIYVNLKQTVSDPQGLTISSGLKQLGFKNIQEVRAGKYFEINLEAESTEAAEKSVDQMCTKLLSNPIIENYRFEISESYG